MAQLILLHKPFRVLSQFRDDQGRTTLASLLSLPNVYPAGRLDYDSEGLLLLTDDGRLQARIADPRHKMVKVYLAQVELPSGMSAPPATALSAITAGIQLRDGISRALSVSLSPAPPDLPVRDPPVAPHRAARSCWLEVQMGSGRNREVRRLLAAAGLPVLRLLRTRIGPWTLGNLAPGAWQELAVALPVSPGASVAPGHGRRRQQQANARPGPTARASRTRRPSSDNRS